MNNPVTQVNAAPANEALAHFKRSFSFETDCWDTHFALQLDNPSFVLLDVRSPELYKSGHIPGAVNLPHGKIIASKMRDWTIDTLFVVYCAGPHCNGAAKAAVKLAQLERPVKLMVGGITGWLDEGFTLQKM
ncbi:rhodanese-like domain-containing protein [Thalassotalea euphylliae]|uniref:rhodanese-like domain-containing protein n=1 Tax=Thalassotalea euphylliae TaxID=1655234 RepID=UPI003624B418